MLCTPAARVLTVMVATPAVSVWDPSVVLPSRNVTVPVGVGAPGAVAATEAWKVSGCPTADGFVPLTVYPSAPSATNPAIWSSL